MEILKYIGDFLLKATGKEEYAPLLEILKKNNFDIKKAASDLTSDAVIPVLKGFLNNAAKSGNGKSSVPCESCGTAPIGGVADKKIISCLNAYLG